MKMTINQIKGLIDQYGEQATLEEILRRVQGNKVFKCPKCNGKGYVTTEYNGYPSGLPDSGFVYEPAFRQETCDLCKGDGYTSHKYKPKMIQDGWE